MPVVLLIIGAALLVTAYNNTFGNLAAALGQDVPGFSKWAVSLMIVGGIGYIPGMQTISRWLLGLVLIVLVLRSYQANSSIFANFANALSGASKPASQTDPATQAATSSSATPTTAQIQGTTSTTTASSSSASSSGASSAATSPYDPTSYLANFLHTNGVSTASNVVSSGFGSTG
jgi:hypothetical protein